VISARLYVGDGFYWIGAGGPDGRDLTIPDATVTGLVGVHAGLAMVLTGTQFGDIAVRVQSGGSDPGLDVAGWDEVVEVTLIVDAGDSELGVTGTDGGPDELLALTAGPGSYRVRLHARGRDIGADLDVVEGEPVEEHLLQIWPAPAAGIVVHKATDEFGQALRGGVDDGAVQSGPDPRLPNGSSVTLDVNHRVTRTGRATVTLERIEAHATGCEFQFRIVVDVSGLTPREEKQARRAVDGYRKAAAPGSKGSGPLTVTLEFSDGRTAPFSGDTGSLPRSGPAVTDFRTSSYPEGRTEVAEEGFWAWPLPPAEPFTLTLEWPAVGIPPASITVDGAMIARVAATLPRE
jgi:hypothetical protein